MGGVFPNPLLEPGVEYRKKCLYETWSKYLTNVLVSSRRTEQVDVMAFIREVLVSNLGRGTDYPDW
jgi:hypothetical protein